MKKIDLHLNTAYLLMEGISETALEWDKKDPSYHYYSQPREHSKESMIRRCVQARQELLQVIKELRKI